jgi:hypothetical protein
MFELSELLLDAKKTVEDESYTEQRFNHNYGIFQRLVDVAERADSDLHFHELVLEDFDLFCVTYVRLDNRKPMFPSPWQTEAADTFEKRDINLFIEPRKIGKSALLSAYVLWKMCKDESTRAVIFAPTQDQLFIMEDIWKALKRCPYLMQEYVQLSAPIGSRGTYGKEYIRFARNESEVVASNLAQSQKADTKRGNKGSLFIVDEIELVTKEVRITVIDDMMADAYSKKKMIMVGTPKVIANPELELEWEAYLEEPETYGVHHINIWEAIEQGCITRAYAQNRFKRLHIPCQWVLKTGVCALHSYDEEAEIDGWKCNKCCLLNEDFVAENMGEFPKAAGKFFPKLFLNACLDGEYPLEINPQPGIKYVMGIDYGLLLNPTQITVFSVAHGVARLVFWEQISPAPPDLGTRDYDPIINRIKEISSKYKGQIYRIFPDATAAGIQITAQLCKGHNAIPRSRIYSNETAAKKEVLGVWLTGPYKHDMLQNYRQIIMDGRLKLPGTEPFWTKFRMEHEHVQVQKVQGTANYLKFKEPVGGTIDLMDSMALGCLALSRKMVQPLLEFKAWGVQG